jgi:thioesterase domain-containing protein
MSGTPVFEMARQLSASGDTVAFLGVVESTFTPVSRRSRAVAAALAALGPVLSRRRQAQVLRSLRRLAGLPVPGEARPYPEGLRIRSSYYRAIANYVPRPLDVPRLVNFRARESSPNPCWLGLGPRCVEVVVPGGHESCVLVHTPALASALAPWLADPVDGSQRDGGPPRSTA